MRNWPIVLGLLLHSLAVFGLPTGLSSSSESALLLARAKGNNKQKVADAADAFASDVATVSSSLNASEWKFHGRSCHEGKGGGKKKERRR